MKLNLGFQDIPYPGDAELTTVKVATYLEDKYHVLDNFFLLHADQIGADIATHVADHITTMMNGGTVQLEGASPQPLGHVTSLFQDFIMNGEMDQLGIPGVPTRAAIIDKSRHRRGPRIRQSRPSFYDTGLYADSFMSWLED